MTSLGCISGASWRGTGPLFLHVMFPLSFQNGVTWWIWEHIFRNLIAFAKVVQKLHFCQCLRTVQCFHNSLQINLLFVAPPHAKSFKVESWNAVLGSVINAKVDKKHLEANLRFTTVYMIALLVFRISSTSVCTHRRTNCTPCGPHCMARCNFMTLCFSWTMRR